MVLLGIDIGTTHTKAALVAENGKVLSLAHRPTPQVMDPDGYTVYDAEELWSAVADLMIEAVGPERPQVVGITGMAEAGLLVDAATGAARTEILPWFDPRPAREVPAIEKCAPRADLFARTGLHPSPKYGLSKILWLSRERPGCTSRAVWLSVPDWIASRLTRQMATDPTLAARTYAYDLCSGTWDGPWLRAFGLEESLFPDVLPSGTVMGSVTESAATQCGLQVGTPVAVCGHDHICSLVAAGISAPGPVLDSMGTAETLIGVLPALELSHAATSGLAVVPHVLEGRWCWLGGLPSSGGAIEWLRRQLGGLEYGDVQALAEEVGPEPSGLLFLPYLLGRGAPAPDAGVRGAFLGLDASQTQGHLIRAVLEGTAYEMEAIRRAAEPLSGRINGVIALGGGTRNRTWMQIKADVTGLVHHVPNLTEPAAQGAALLAGWKAGACSQLPQEYSHPDAYRVEPRISEHQRYRQVFDTQFLPVTSALSRPFIEEVLVS